ncbi:SUR7 family protein pun1 [Trichoderma lentiforme]|uniref:SUR7 family protein pun1 n=1 Tax=Trichoderma lentiforme TaxID=1567552 RepID=A0A9P4XJG4_9HYPO|nr:SUR7 family protein pun1 [Trichoderma lentiforme]
MGKGGRIACIAVPYLWTIGALVAIIFVGIGSTDSDSTTLNKLYFMRADLSNVTAVEATRFGDQLLNLTSTAMRNANATEELAAAMEEAEKDGELRDFYNIGLFGYCSGDKEHNEFEVDFCSKPKGSFWFNPLEVWHLNISGVPDLLPTHLQSELKTYQKVSHWMFVSYVLAFATTCLQLLVGFSAIFSRIGSLATTVVAVVATIFMFAASITSTALFVVLTGVFNSSLKEYGVKANLGGNLFAASWLAAALSLASSVLWLFSSCCCSGRSSAPRSAPQHNYEKVDMGAGSASHTGHTTAPAPTFDNTNTAYEPYRHK